MRWLWFVGSLVCFVVVFKTTSVGLALLCLLGALVFMIVGTLAVAAQRIENSRGDVGRIIGPEEIRHMREAEERRKAAAQGQDQVPAANAAGNETAPAGPRTTPDAGIVGAATAAAMIAAETAGRDAASPPGPTADDASDADNAGGDV